MSRATVYAPASIGNVGPGFDVLGLAVSGLGDRITVEIIEGDESKIVDVSGQDASLVPRNARENCATIAALSLLRRVGDTRHVAISIHRELPLAGGLGASAAASVGAAVATMYALGKTLDVSLLLSSALDGEEKVAGRHLDNIAPSLLGGLCVSLSTQPPQAAKVPTQGSWWLALVTPAFKLTTKKARGVLPSLVSQEEFVQQMAHTSGLITAFASGDYELARASLKDSYAEPRRAPLINGFTDAKKAALAAGALGCSISGAGPSIFALCADEKSASHAAQAMKQALLPLESQIHVGPMDHKGARRV
jgi:homoserine kinase